MSIKSVQMEALKLFARTINDSELNTKTYKKKFMFSVEEKGFCFTPSRTGLPRFEGYPNIERFLERFNIEKSIKTIDYRDISVNASYLLVVIQKYLDSSK